MDVERELGLLVQSQPLVEPIGRHEAALFFCTDCLNIPVVTFSACALIGWNFGVTVVSQKGTNPQRII